MQIISSAADGITLVLREGAMCHYLDEDAIAPLWVPIGSEDPIGALGAYTSCRAMRRRISLMSSPRSSRSA